ncbi:hypothetical protein HPB48_022347 [Haemaphysalis longicornis]|uniref:Uncharacterized protein n=1 Tax=Haemaphysalis longicornis TaxID=44386 RepID=A0A9J6FZB0_HAELO|nr:hypothetical protein HPB48_022347 [Haemaphysalis longicornis]
MCNQLNGDLHRKKVWSLIRYLISPGNSKSALNRRLDMLAANSSKKEDLLDELAKAYIPERDYPTYNDYKSNTDNTCCLHQPITRPELTEAIAEALRDQSKLETELFAISASQIRDIF